MEIAPRGLHTMKDRGGQAFKYVLLAVGAASLCSAANITYNVNLTIGAGSVTGDILTDGTIGTLGAADIIDYNLLLSDPAASPNPNNPSNTFSLSCCNFFPFDGSDLSATATNLLFDFSGTDSGVVDIAHPSLDFDVCFSTSGGAFGPSSFCEGAGETLTFLGGTFPPGPVFDFQFTPLSGTDIIGTASNAPELSTLALLGTGIALFGLRLKVQRRSTPALRNVG